MNKLSLPGGAKAVISALAGAGFDAYVVGGCVRDSLLGLEAHDWDICTNAAPPEVMSCLPGRRMIETGLKHGTVTVMMEDGAYEVTTFRLDGAHAYGGEPDSRPFAPELCEDLSRRDLTINAMAYSDRTGLIDLFGGQEALRNREIACVGAPFDRFGEDPLRILRALRFAAVYGFCIHGETERAIHACAPRLKDVAAERINAELGKLLCGKGVGQILLDHSDVMSVIIPELKPCIGFEQNNPYHQYTLYDHMVHGVANYTGSDLSVKIALLLHDIGKPLCRTEDKRGSHFNGHGVLSRDIADEVTKRLRFDNRTRSEVLDLVLYHDSLIEPAPKAVRRWLNKIGEVRLRQLIQVHMADIKAQAEETQEDRIRRCLAVGTVLEEVLAEEQCFSLQDLAIRGNDIRLLGVPQGREVGEVLCHVLDMVINGGLPNERAVLIDSARQYIARTGLAAKEGEPGPGPS